MECPGDVLAWGPRSGDFPARRTDRVLHSSRLDLLLVKGKTPVAVVLGEEFEDGNRVRAATEEFVGTEGNTEALPDASG
jgi:hypothetical protein